MKLIIIFLSMSFSCNSQTVTKGSLLYLTTVANEGYERVGYDTIPVVMLVSDTSAYRGIMTNVNWINPIERAEQEHHLLTWIKGFLVREIKLKKAGSHQSGDFMWYNERDEYTHTPKQYLCDRGLPMPKEIIIWLTRQ